MYSQHQEEAVITKYFESKGTGHFVDIGAYDGITFSNTRRLVELGWSGVMVEPSPKPFCQLLEHYGKNPAVTLVNSAVVPRCRHEDGGALIAFYDSDGDALSTSSTSHVEKWKSYRSFVPFYASTCTCKDVLKLAVENTLKSPLGFINLDVESQNWALFRELVELDFGGASMLCVEHDGMADEMMGCLKPMGYSMLAYNGENLIVAKPVNELAAH